MKSAINLKTRYGQGRTNPSENQIKAAIGEIFHEKDSHLQEGDYAEHPNAWLSYGFQNAEEWSVYVLDLYRDGQLVFTLHEDQDDSDAAFTRVKTGVSESEAFRLWMLLHSGKVDLLMQENWSQ